MSANITVCIKYFQVFREVAYKARNRQDILAGVDEFLDQVTALPPGEWDPKIRIEPPQSVPSQVCLCFYLFQVIIVFKVFDPEF